MTDGGCDGDCQCNGDWPYGDWPYGDWRCKGDWAYEGDLQPPIELGEGASGESSARERTVGERPGERSAGEYGGGAVGGAVGVCGERSWMGAAPSGGAGGWRIPPHPTPAAARMAAATLAGTGGTNGVREQMDDASPKFRPPMFRPPMFRPAVPSASLVPIREGSIPTEGSLPRPSLRRAPISRVGTRWVGGGNLGGG